MFARRVLPLGPEKPRPAECLASASSSIGLSLQRRNSVLGEEDEAEKLQCGCHVGTLRAGEQGDNGMSRAVLKQAGVPTAEERGRRSEPLVWRRGRPGPLSLGPCASQAGSLQAEGQHQPLRTPGPTQDQDQIKVCGGAEKRPGEEHVYSEGHRDTGEVKRPAPLRLQGLPTRRRREEPLAAENQRDPRQAGPSRPEPWDPAPSSPKAQFK